MDSKDSAKVQQVTFGLRIGRASLVHPGAPLPMLGCLPGSSDLLPALTERRCIRPKLGGRLTPQVAPPRTRSDPRGL